MPTEPLWLSRSNRRPGVPNDLDTAIAPSALRSTYDASGGVTYRNAHGLTFFLAGQPMTPGAPRRA